jgi:hypothetical protein
MPFVVMLVLFLFVGGLLAHAQIGGSSVQPVNGPSYSVPDHPMHAEQHDLRPEVSLIGGGSYTYAQGERPLWEFGGYAAPTPLGDVARRYREEHAKVEKAQIVWNQQGQ